MFERFSDDARRVVVVAQGDAGSSATTTSARSACCSRCRDDVPVVVNDRTVERVRFLDETEAEVSVGIWLAGTPQPMIQPAHAVRQDGTWKVSRSSLQHFAQQAGPCLRRPPAP